MSGAITDTKRAKKALYMRRWRASRPKRSNRVYEPCVAWSPWHVWSPKGICYACGEHKEDLRIERKDRAA